MDQRIARCCRECAAQRIPEWMRYPTLGGEPRLPQLSGNGAVGSPRKWRLGCSSPRCPIPSDIVRIKHPSSGDITLSLSSHSSSFLPFVKDWVSFATPCEPRDRDQTEFNQLTSTNAGHSIHRRGFRNYRLTRRILSVFMTSYSTRVTDAIRLVIRDQPSLVA